MRRAQRKRRAHGGETPTPTRQTRLDWAFKRGAEAGEPVERGAEADEAAEQPWAQASPYKKLEQKMNAEQLAAFKRKLEHERDEKAKQQKAHTPFLC